MTSTLGCLASLLGQADPHFWMPVQASEQAPATDWLFHFLLYMSAFFFGLIVVLMVLFTVRYRRRSPQEVGVGPTHNTLLEIVWTGIPVLLVIFIFFAGFRGYMNIFGPGGSANAYEIQVTGQKWKWQFTYPNGHVDDALHLPVNTPIQLTMTSEDVIHSLFIPAFRVKRDVLPGRYVKMFFRATQPGEYTAFCTQYCGTGHSAMLARVIVHPPGEFEKWLQNAANELARLAPADAGALLYRRRGCQTCHSTDGSRLVGPTFKGLFGSSLRFIDGSTAVADENYIRDCILKPNTRLLPGYDPVMPTFQGRITDKEITDLIAFIKTLR